MMAWSALTAGLDLDVVGGTAPVEVGAVTIDSRQAKAGTVFVACRGATKASLDGHRFLASAHAAGASALVVERGREAEVPAGAFAVAASDTRAVVATLAERIEGEPSSTLEVIGVTGTNGKTTVSHLLARTLKGLGKKSAVLGTLGVGAPDAPRSLGFTTPEAEILSRALRELVDEGFDDVVMEVSSIALTTRRADGVRAPVTEAVSQHQAEVVGHPDGVDQGILPHPGDGERFLEQQPVPALATDHEMRPPGADVGAQPSSSALARPDGGGERTGRADPRRGADQRDAERLRHPLRTRPDQGDVARRQRTAQRRQRA